MVANLNPKRGPNPNTKARCTLPVYTGRVYTAKSAVLDILDIRIYGPYLRPVYTGSVYRT